MNSVAQKAGFICDFHKIKQASSCAPIKSSVTFYGKSALISPNGVRLPLYIACFLAGPAENYHQPFLFSDSHGYCVCLHVIRTQL